MYNFMSIWNIYLQNNKQQQCNTKHVIFAQIKSWVNPMSPSDIYHSRRGGCGQKKKQKKEVAKHWKNEDSGRTELAFSR